MTVLSSKEKRLTFLRADLADAARRRSRVDDGSRRALSLNERIAYIKSEIARELKEEW